MNRFYILMIFVFSASLSACGEEIAYGTAFENSQEAWVTAKAQHAASYRYESEISSFTGYGELTVITVDDDDVVRRRFASYEDLAFRANRLEAWVEEANELGSHLSGGPVLTIDALYARCRADILTVDPDENEISFTVDQRGLLDTCTYVPKGCLDDCEEGVRISAIDF
jgi:hypothetical protein